MNKSNKSLAGTLAVFAIYCAATAAQATEVQVVGRVDAVQSRTSTVSVLGQTFVSTRVLNGRDGRLAGVNVGDYVAISGEAVKGSLVAKSIIPLGIPYVPGSSKVFLHGTISGYSESTGSAQVSGLKVDLSQVYASGPISFLPGDVLEVVGTQGLSGGTVSVSKILDASDTSSLSDAVASLSIQGTGALSIQGTGALSIQGTGTQSIQGTEAESIQGTGVLSIQGTGSLSIQGTGKLSIQGTGKQSIQGTGVQSIQGTGTRSIQGTGKMSIQGTGSN